MKKIVLLIIMYLMGILLVIDMVDYAFIPEQYFFNENISDLLFTSLLLLYFFGILTVILVINMYLVKRNNNEDYSYIKWVSIIFLPLFLITYFDFTYSLIGIIDDPMRNVGLFQRLLLILLIAGNVIFSVGYFKINNEKDKMINNYIYMLISLITITTLLYGIS